MCDATQSSCLWEQWLEESADRFLLFARQQTRCEADAEDVLQDALVETWNRNGGDIPPPAMVFATIRRRAIDRARQAGARERRERSDQRLDELWEFPEVEHRSDREVLLAALRDLPQDQQDVVFLRIWGELGFREISESLGAPLPTVSSRFQAALKRLKSSLCELWT